jgi:cytoskeletal protein CcmA (bactofilin family)
MFKNEPQETKNKQAETIIGPSVKVKGNFHGEGNIIIEGEVEGSVKTKNNLNVVSGAKISADIEAKNARIGGEITGAVKVDGFLEIESSAKINGDINCEEISIARGAKINGNCRMEKVNSEIKKA